VLTYNGEVYNFAELRRELEQSGIGFRGHSDTEVILAAFQTWGIEASLRRFVGMFAMGLWDRQSRELKLIRDRLGIKPLYYGWSQDMFLFGSELKALKAHPAFKSELNHDALCLYLRHNYIPAPYSIYRGIFKLEPGHVLTVPFSATGLSDLRDAAYWSLEDVTKTAFHNRFRSEQEALEALESTLREAVTCRMVADVPLGAFLSGGVDSSTVVAIMQAHSRDRVRTFSIGFHEPKYDEAQHARRVAAHLGTDHTELYVTPEEAMRVVPSLPSMFDEPFSDSSQIPTYLVSKLARRSVTVSLSGDGGDELFAGYDRYDRALAIWKKLSGIPPAFRTVAAASIRHAPMPLLGLVGAIARSVLHRDATADRIKKLGTMLGSRSIGELYPSLISHWQDPASIVKQGSLPDYLFSAERNWRISEDPLENMCFADMRTYLPDDILTKVDRASMAVSLEARVPLLDHRFVELSARLPMTLKRREGVGKWPLRQVLYKYVPRDLVDRPKMGFGVPIGVWLRGPLREWAGALLDSARIAQQGIFDNATIQKAWNEHCSGKRQWHYLLWDVLMFQAWLEQI
jgi:asparagine synthase (glutamine-hydrolysing)